MLPRVQFLRRFLSTGTSKSPLAVLRKRTGFPMGKCREALVRFPDDVQSAEEWLQEQAQREGWAKAEQLRGRDARQGHVGVLIKRDRAAIVEVNCETDFVARNDSFKSLVASVVRTLFASGIDASTTDSTASSDIIPIDDARLSAMVVENGDNVAETVAKSVGHLAENIKVPRGYLFRADTGFLSSFVYNGIMAESGDVEMGRYAAIAHLSMLGEEDFDPSPETQKIGERLCQHIIGSNPRGVGGASSPVQELLEQAWLFDSGLLVGEVLKKEGLTVRNFLRCECGETMD